MCIFYVHRVLDKSAEVVFHSSCSAQKSAQVLAQLDPPQVLKDCQTKSRRGSAQRKWDRHSSNGSLEGAVLAQDTFAEHRR
mmetsp:Transcript_66426/g.138727  ORF Transcript_66426/g.138727 Transcript_66426/m.138727 type:complete len:81 (-) Transcript_66426:764-1006(-)